MGDSSKITSGKQLDTLLGTGGNFKKLKKEERQYRDLFAGKINKTIDGTNTTKKK